MDMDVVRWNDPAELEIPFDGAERRELASNEKLMLVHNRIEQDRVYPAHTHDETVQGVFVIEGSIEVFGDRSVVLEEGDSCVISPGFHHGFRGVAPESRILVAFTPPVDISPSDIDE